MFPSEGRDATAYFVEHRNRYPLWFGGEIKSRPGSCDYPEPRSFEDSMIRNLAAALAQINGPARL
jgi:hypothetical protein